MKTNVIQVRKRLLSVLLALLGIACISVFAVLLTIFFLGPTELKVERNTVLYSATDHVIAVTSGVENREWIPLEEISNEVINTTILIEDQHFYEHAGFDLKRIGAAVWKNVTSLSFVEGASTITQQLARNLYLTHEKTWNRKWKEALYAIRLEMHYSKDAILEAYLNTIYYGHGAYGVQAASEHFFNKDQAELSYAEVAMLTGIPKGPTHYSPFSNQENAEARKELILNRMLNEGLIDTAHYQLAMQEVIQYRTLEEGNSETLAAHYQDMVLAEAAILLDTPIEVIRSSGLQIYTTLDESLQEALEDTVEEVIPGSSELETAVMSMNPHNGEILALLGGRDYERSVFNRATSALRMPGSSFKPFVYYAALEQGYTALTELESRPTIFQLKNGEVYQPSNFRQYYAYEPITLAQAIALSDNVYAVRTMLALGVDNVVETVGQFGFSNDLPTVPSLALGTASVSLLEMTNAYSMLANGGKEVGAHTIKKIIDWRGTEIYTKTPSQSKQVLNEQTTFILTHLLTGMFHSNLNGYMPVTGTSIAGQLSRNYAGKSGTTEVDHWMVGYSPNVVTSVWTGYDDNRNVNQLEEANYAKQMWASVMEVAHRGEKQEQFPMPNGVVGLPIDVESGLRSTPNCSSKSVVMYFVKGTEPTAYCEEELHDSNEDSGIFKKWFQLFFDS